MLLVKMAKIWLLDKFQFWQDSVATVHVGRLLFQALLLVMICGLKIMGKHFSQEKEVYVSPRFLQEIFTLSYFISYEYSCYNRTTTHICRRFYSSHWLPTSLCSLYQKMWKQNKNNWSKTKSKVMGKKNIITWLQKLVNDVNMYTLASQMTCLAKSWISVNRAIYGSKPSFLSIVTPLWSIECEAWFFKKCLLKVHSRKLPLRI